jgi:hypothetical protein
MLSVVTFKWRPPPGYRSQFRSEHVNVLRSMVARHYPEPHRFICITDDANGLAPGIETVKLWTDHSGLPNPRGRHNPSCYRRLKLFAADAASIVGERFAVFDIDTVICGDLRPLLNRTEDFVIWGDTHPRTFYNGSFYLLRAGTRRQVWEDFDPATSPAAAKAAGHFGSDQAWISYKLGLGQPTFGMADGIYSFRVHVGGKPLPANARIVFFHGKIDPWSPAAQRLKWVKENWR